MQVLSQDLNILGDKAGNWKLTQQYNSLWRRALPVMFTPRN